MKLYTTIYGSKLYGTNVPTSDTDYKTVILPSIESLLMGGKLKNTSNSTGNNDSSNGVDDIDHEMIPIQVFLSDFINGQIYALEIAFSALDDSTQEKIYHDYRFKGICETLTSNYLTSNMRAMIGYALGQANKYSIKGTRLDSLLTLDKFLEDYPNSTLLSELHFPPEILSSHIKLGVYINRSKLSCPCIRVLGKIFPMDISIGEAKRRTKATIKRYGSRSINAKNSNGRDWKAISHALRIFLQAVDILEINKLVFPLPADRAEHLLAIKNGLIDWDDVNEEFGDALVKIDELTKTTNLKSTDHIRSEFNEWSINILKDLYGV